LTGYEHAFIQVIQNGGEAGARRLSLGVGRLLSTTKPGTFFFSFLALGDVASYTVHYAFFGEVLRVPLDPGDISILTLAAILEPLCLHLVGRERWFYPEILIF
jgi:hypothetical protein